MAVRRNQYSDTQILAFQTTLQVLSAETSIAYITAPHKTPKIHDILTHAVRQIRAISARPYPRTVCPVGWCEDGRKCSPCELVDPRTGAAKHDPQPKHKRL